MPGFDRTGPRGLGPMTGGGRGFCNPYMGGMRAPFMGRGFGRGFGMGRGMGRWWMGRMFFPAGTGMPPFGSPMTQEQEREFLRSQAQALKEELNRIDNRVSELERESQ